ncbi:MAG: hypothetical protein IKP93_01415 [Paludibacteraceae bacterium]|nr:hypothetical protein [Paludibacteraceae bacterium]
MKKIVISLMMAMVVVGMTGCCCGNGEKKCGGCDTTEVKECQHKCQHECEHKCKHEGEEHKCCKHEGEGEHKCCKHEGEEHKCCKHHQEGEHHCCQHDTTAQK